MRIAYPAIDKTSPAWGRRSDAAIATNLGSTVNKVAQIAPTVVSTRHFVRWNLFAFGLGLQVAVNRGEQAGDAGAHRLVAGVHNHSDRRHD